MAVYLISEQAIKDTTILNDNVDSKLIWPGYLGSTGYAPTILFR